MFATVTRKVVVGVNRVSQVNARSISQVAMAAGASNDSAFTVNPTSFSAITDRRTNCIHTTPLGCFRRVETFFFFLPALWRSALI
jgi:hypothetical protein